MPICSLRFFFFLVCLFLFFFSFIRELSEKSGGGVRPKTEDRVCFGAPFYRPFFPFSRLSLALTTHYISVASLKVHCAAGGTAEGSVANGFLVFFFFKLLKNANCDNRVLHSRQREREKDTATHTHTTTTTTKKKKGNRAQGVFRVHTKRHTVFYFFTLFCCLLLFFFCCYATKPDLLISFFFVVVIEQSLQRHLFFSLFFPRSFERKQRSDTKKGHFWKTEKMLCLQHTYVTPP